MSITLDGSTGISISGNNNLSIGTLAAGNTTITGTLATNSTTITGTLSASANVNLDSGTLFVDGTNNRVGINNTSPTQALTVAGNTFVNGAVTFANSTGNNIFITSTGYLGVANSSPGSPLTVQIPSGGVLDGLFYSGIMLNRAGNSVYTGIRYDSSGTARWRAGLMPNNNYQIARFDTSNTAYDDNFNIDNATGTVSITSPSGAEPFTQLNVTGVSGNQIGGILVSGGSQSHIRFQTGNTSSWGGTGSKRWQLRAGEGSNLDNISFYSWTKGNNVWKADSDGLITKPYQVSFQAYNGSAYTINGTDSICPLDTLSWQVGTGYSTTNKRFTAPVAGRYLFTFVGTMTSNGDHVYNAIYYVVNGSGTAIRMRMVATAAASDWGGITGAVILTLAQNDYVELSKYTDGSNTITAPINESRWCGYLLG